MQSEFQIVTSRPTSSTVTTKILRPGTTGRSSTTHSPIATMISGNRGSTTTMPVSTTQPNRATTIRHVHHNITHASFMNRDHNDGLLSPQLRQAILEKGLERSSKYEPERVTTRTNDVLEVRDYTRLAGERNKRSKVF